MKIVLHIGTPKTGTSSLQATLFTNRDKLRDIGILYPEVERFNRHSLLAIPFFDNNIPREFWRKMGRNKAQLDTLAWSYWNQIADEAAADPAIHTLVISGETFFRVDDIAPLQEFLQHRFPGAEIQVYCYIRNPVSHYLSRLQQVLKASHQIEPPSKNDWANLLTKWNDLGLLTLAELNRETLVDGDVVQDFLSKILGGKGRDYGIRSLSQNTTISAEGMMIIWAFRKYIFPDKNNHFKPESNQLLSIIQKADKHLEKSKKFKSPRLHQHIQDQIIALTQPDVLALRSRYGFSYRDKIFYKPIDLNEKNETMRAKKSRVLLSDLIEIDQDRLEQLHAVVLDRLLRSSTSASELEGAHQVLATNKL